MVPEWADKTIQALQPRPPKPGMQWRLTHRRLKDGALVGDPWTDDAVSLLSKCVCGPCNSTWMSNIESAAKPAMIPLILGQTTVLDTQSQNVIATWLGLKAVIEQHSRERPPYFWEWRSEFYRGKTPPSSWHIRLGRYIGTMWTGSFTGVSIDATVQHRLVPFPMKMPGFVFTAIIGNFFGQVVGIQRQGIFPMNTKYFIEIWPHPILRVAQYSVRPDSPSQSWPPERGLDDTHLAKCIQDFTEPKD